MDDIQEIRLAPKLDRVCHTPIRSKDIRERWEYWRVKDYPGHSEHGKDGLNWDQNNWETAINIFEDRIYGRFLNIITSTNQEPFSGFAVMALACLLCETLQQFYDGVDKSKSPTKDFIRFLASSSFKQYFGTDNTPITSMAAIFYDQIRCGILHMAEAKKTSLIEVEDKFLLVDWSDDQHTGLIVNRNKFYAQLVMEIEYYIASLRIRPANPTSHPWKNFKKKMDYICRI
jgi:hypothetical protein